MRRTFDNKAAFMNYLQTEVAPVIASAIKVEMANNPAVRKYGAKQDNLHPFTLRPSNINPVTRLDVSGDPVTTQPGGGEGTPEFSWWICQVALRFRPSLSYAEAKRRVLSGEFPVPARATREAKIKNMKAEVATNAKAIIDLCAAEATKTALRYRKEGRKNVKFNDVFKEVYRKQTGRDLDQDRRKARGEAV